MLIKSTEYNKRQDDAWDLYSTATEHPSLYDFINLYKYNFKNIFIVYLSSYSAPPYSKTSLDGSARPLKYCIKMKYRPVV